MSTKSEAIMDWRRKNKYGLEVEMGVVVSVTKIYKSTTVFTSLVPYFVAIIEVGNQRKRVVGQLVIKEGWVPKIGDEVWSTNRVLYTDGDQGVIHYGIKWEKVHGVK